MSLTHYNIHFISYEQSTITVLYSTAIDFALESLRDITAFQVYHSHSFTEDVFCLHFSHSCYLCAALSSVHLCPFTLCQNSNTFSGDPAIAVMSLERSVLLGSFT